MNSVPNINKCGVAKRPNIQTNQWPEGVRGKGVYFGEFSEIIYVYGFSSLPKYQCVCVTNQVKILQQRCGCRQDSAKTRPTFWPNWKAKVEQILFFQVLGRIHICKGGGIS